MNRAIKEIYLAPHEISIARFAEASGVALKHMSAIVKGHAAIKAEMAARMAAVLGTTAQYWLILQNVGRSVRRTRATGHQQEPTAIDAGFRMSRARFLSSRYWRPPGFCAIAALIRALTADQHGGADGDAK